MWRATLGFLVLAIAITWPLARHLPTRVPNDLGDPLLITYLLNWNATVMPLTERWWHPPFFWPTANVMALSEHMLGLSVVATPLRWLGLDALSTYNVLFIASFWTAGVGGWILGHTITGRAIPAWIAGLVFICSPYRMSHLAHLQILASCGVPVMFAALHRAAGWRRGGSRQVVAADGHAATSVDPEAAAAPAREWRWVVLAVACWVWQGMVSGYFLAFLPIGIAIWLLWFAPRRGALWARLAITGGTSALVLTPLLYRYSAVHAAGGFRRRLEEVLEFSADVAGVWQVSDRLALWGGILPNGFTEEQLFPGLATLLLVGIGASWLPRTVGRVRPVTLACLASAAVFMCAALGAWMAPGEFTLLGSRFSWNHPHKPLGMVWLSLLAAAISSRTCAAAWRQASPSGGYLALAIASWILALGPVPTFYGERVWYLAPYSWLYDYVPGFTEFRVPARLYVITTTALAALAALGAERLLQGRRRLAMPLVAVLAILVVAEGWLARMPLAAAPQPIVLPDAATLVLELPAAEAERDAAAMYRSLFHGRPVVNGWSGYRPPSMDAARRMDRGDVTTLVAWARHRPLAVVIDPAASSAAAYQKALEDAGAGCAPSEAAIVCLLTGGERPK